MSARFLLSALLVFGLTACDAVKPKPIKGENALEEALVAAQKDPAQQDRFETILLGSRVLVRTDAATRNRLNTPGNDETIAFYRFNFRGRETVPIYTSALRMGQVMPGENCVVLGGRQALALTKGYDVCVNCGLSPAAIFSVADVERLLGGKAPRTEKLHT